jgi:hypothetical protein
MGYIAVISARARKRGGLAQRRLGAARHGALCLAAQQTTGQSRSATRRNKPQANQTFRGAAFKGETHRGFTTVFKQLWPSIRAAVDSEIVNGNITHVFVTGHSQGGPVATYTAYAIDRYLKRGTDFEPSDDFTLDLVVFESPLRECLGRAWGFWGPRWRGPMPAVARPAPQCLAVACRSSARHLTLLVRCLGWGNSHEALTAPDLASPHANPCAAGNSRFARSMSRINSRNIKFENDIIGA